MKMTKTKKLTEIAVSVAMAVICSFVKVWEMPQGGSVALTMIPLLFIAQKRGALTGFIAGGLYGLVSALIAGVLYHPTSLLLDYILAFGLLGLAGFFKGSTFNIILGSIVGVGGRFLSSLASGAVLFAEYAPKGQNPWFYSLIYQSTYMIPELVITASILILLWKKAHKLYEI